jgi:hypothetical protein
LETQRLGETGGFTSAAKATLSIEGQALLLIAAGRGNIP